MNRSEAMRQTGISDNNESAFSANTAPYMYEAHPDTESIQGESTQKFTVLPQECIGQWGRLENDYRLIQLQG